ncbi:MAG: class I SAM-dependent methyltransferase [Atribacterota bacterium]|nr:class I SAM-dependent methyltransferase [Atribacterota bacterium]
MNWRVYNDLAWTEHIISSPEEYKDEALYYIDIIKKYINKSSANILHLGCGAGGLDYHFKNHFQVTGVDISEGMLKIARETNPEVKYISGDMRTVQLKNKFDAVIIPDSIMYMSTLKDLQKVINIVISHLNHNGFFLIVTHLKEDFQNNNFVYSGENGDTHITVFENNYLVSDTVYEAAMVFLIRQNGKLNIYHEVHILGVFYAKDWQKIFKDSNLKVDIISMDHLYDKYIQENGQYRLKIFSGILN